MKIENIIEDIVNDTIDMRNKVQEQLNTLYPSLQISIDLPGLNALSAIKIMEFTFYEDRVRHSFSVDIHTHNGNRVFEYGNRQPTENIQVPRHPRQEIFVNILREVIKKRKTQLKSKF